MTDKDISPGIRIAAELLRRKGLSLADVQRMPRHPEPWYMRLSWSAEEEEDYRRWWETYVLRHVVISKRQLPRFWALFALEYGLHQRDLCTRPDHQAAHVPDLPRAQWLPVAEAARQLPLSSRDAP
jgi:hypothetical protein